jgi:hypothetical protein
MTPVELVQISENECTLFPEKVLLTTQFQTSGRPRKTYFREDGGDTEEDTFSEFSNKKAHQQEFIAILTQGKVYEMLRMV